MKMGESNPIDEEGGMFDLPMSCGLFDPDRLSMGRSESRLVWTTTWDWSIRYRLP